MPTPPVDEILKLDVEERLRVIQLIWDSIAAEQVPVTPADRALVDELEREDDASPDDVLTWSDAKAQLRRRQ